MTEATRIWTPLRLVEWSADYLSERGVAQARLDVELLLAHILGVGRLDLYLQFDRPLHASELAAFKEGLLRRAKREPLQHILGTMPFREIEVRVDRRALIPRPETELLVGVVREWCDSRSNRPTTALDVGTGTGVIALSLLHEDLVDRVVATDVSSDALDLARENACALGLESRIDFRHGPVYTVLEPGERFELIISNPPYVAAHEADTLEPEVLDWEPREALFGGPDGSDVIDALVSGAAEHLSPSGLLALEVGATQARAVAERARGVPDFSEVSIREDWTGRERFVLAEGAGYAST